MAQQKKKDTTARDIRRKVDQVKKYIDQLKELGVESCFCYISTKTGGVFTYGHPSLRDTFNQGYDGARMKFEEVNSGVDQDYVLPRLPVPVREMNGPTVKTAVTNLMKDLGISFSGPKPAWWPCAVQFINPWKTTDRAGTIILADVVLLCMYMCDCELDCVTCTSLVCKS